MQREIPEGAWDAFLTQQKAMREMASKLPGLVWARQLRAKGQDQALVVARFRSRQDFEEMLESSQYNQTIERIPVGATLVRTECFEVVSDVGPK